jgi:hypothetical protein
MIFTSKRATIATVALFISALAVTGPAIAADNAAGGAPSAGQPKAAAPVAPPAAKAADKAATTAPTDCGKLTDAKAKDDCMKKAQAAPGAASGATGSTSKY